MKSHYLKCSFPNHGLQEKTTTNNCLIYGILRICAHLKTFYAVEQQRRCPNTGSNAKTLAFCHKKGIDMLKLGCTLPNLANFCLHKSTSAKFYPFTETGKNWMQKIREDMVGCPSIVFTRKAVVDKSFIRIQEKFVNLLLALTQARFILILCVSPCQQDYTRVGIMTQNLISLNLNKTNPETLRTWLCHNSKDKDLTVKLRVSTPQELRKD